MNDLTIKPITLTLQQLSDYAAGSIGVRTAGKQFRNTSPALVLMDGTDLSVQAGEYLYSEPREDFATLYTAVEVGFPTFDVPLEWLEYAEDSNNPTGTVYPYIPIEMVLKYINAVGIDPSKFPENFILEPTISKV